MRTVLIDADSLIYIIAWNHKEVGDTEMVQAACRSIFYGIIDAVDAQQYLGFFSDISQKVFRTNKYKYKPYKGNRGPKEEWVTQWEPIILKYFMEEFGFIRASGFEADDYISACAPLFEHPIISSPDKDLRQIPGEHFNHSKLLTPETVIVTPEEASMNFWLQMLTGDTTDNIQGIPGLGAVKAKKLLEGCCTDLDMQLEVFQAYVKYYGEYYGRMIYDETLMAVMLLGKNHPFVTVCAGPTWYNSLVTHLIKEVRLVPSKEDESYRAVLSMLNWS